jgi:hypothetical protein
MELVELLEGLEEDVLGDVFGVLAVLGDVQGGAVDLAVVLAYEALEGGGVAGLGALNEREVGVRLDDGGGSGEPGGDFGERWSVGRHRFSLQDSGWARVVAGPFESSRLVHGGT